LLNQGTIKKDVIAKIREHSLLGEIFASALLNSNTSAAHIKEAIEESGRAVNYKLEKYLPTLGTIAAVAPLLGLLGTVIGMVDLFSSFTNSGHDVAVFARGISVALYNTAAGIVVAVPAMIFYRFFRSKADDLIFDMEQQALKLIESIGVRK
jgi:biopolymer transport protein ExbB